MKVKSETEHGRCDLCGVGTPVTTINGGLWWVCASCMVNLYGGEEE